MAKRGFEDESAVAVVSRAEPPVPKQLKEIVLNDFENAVAVDPLGTAVVLETDTTFAVLNLSSGARKTWTKLDMTGYRFALGSHRTDAHLLGQEQLMLVIATTPWTASLPSSITVLGGPELETALLPTELLGGRIAGLEAVGMGLVVAIVTGVERAHVMVADPAVSQKCLTELAAHAPANVSQLVRDRLGRCIDVVLSKPAPGSETRRFRLFAGPNTEWEPLTVGTEADLIVGPIDALLSAECSRYMASPHTFITLGYGRPVLQFGGQAEAVIWDRNEIYLVTFEFGPVITPVCRGSETIGASIYQDQVRLTNKTESDAFPTVGAGKLLLSMGRLYMVD